MKNPAAVLPGATQAIQSVYKSVYAGGVPQETLELVHLRASQINGCAPCVDSAVKGLAKLDQSAERIGLVMIAVTNLFNRLNATTRQIAGAW